jgi:hypothetical protein
MDQWVPWRKGHLTAHGAPERQPGRSQERNVLSPSIVRVYDIESLRRQKAAQAQAGAEPEWRQFEIFGCRTFGERAVNGASDQLTMVSPPKAARQRQQ